MNKRIWFRVPKDLLESVDRIAKREGRTRNEVIAEAIQLWIAEATRLLRQRKGFANG